MAELFSNPFPRFFSDNVKVTPGGQLFFYEVGTTTPKTTYSDNALSAPNENPVILSASGVVPPIYLDGTYDIVFQDKNGVQIDTATSVNAGMDEFSAWAPWDSGVDYDSGPSVIVTASNGRYYKSIQTPNLGNEPSVSPAFWERVYLIGDPDPVQGGPLNSNDEQIQRAEFIDYSETVNAIGDFGGGSQDFNLELGNVVECTVSTSAVTFSFSNPPATGLSGGFTLWITNGGSQTITWPASVDWPSGAAPTLTAAGLDKLAFETLDNGTTWTGDVLNLDYS